MAFDDFFKLVKRGDRVFVEPKFNMVDSEENMSQGILEHLRLKKHKPKIKKFKQ